MKKLAAVFLSVCMLLCFASCSQIEDAKSEIMKDFDLQNEITVVSREVGSGVRSFFSGIFNLLDGTEETAEDLISNAKIKEDFALIKSEVEKDMYAIGYIPLRSVDSDVKALKINGVEPTVENVNNGKYKLAHKINAVTKDGNKMAADFLSFLASKQGQEVIKNAGYISLSSDSDFKSTMPEGTLKVSVSDSSYKLMEALISKYNQYNSKLKIEADKANSDMSVKKLDSDDCSLCLISRELKKSESQKGYKETHIATDAIAVIVSPKNSLSDISDSDVTKIFKGDYKLWKDISK